MNGGDWLGAGLVAYAFAVYALVYRRLGDD